MSIRTKERGSQKRIRRPLRGDFRQCEYIEKLWSENQTSHEGLITAKNPRCNWEIWCNIRNYVNILMYSYLKLGIGIVAMVFDLSQWRPV